MLWNKIYLYWLYFLFCYKKNISFLYYNIWFDESNFFFLFLVVECMLKLKLNFLDGFEDERDKRLVYIVNNNVFFFGGVVKFFGKSCLCVF